MAKNCRYCNRKILNEFMCKFCGNEFCNEHSLPENHNCKGLKKWGKEKIGDETEAGKKTLEYEFGGKPPKGYFGYKKLDKIKYPADAEQSARESLANKYFNNFLGFKMTDCDFTIQKDRRIWILKGVVKVKKLLWGFKEINVEVKIDGETGAEITT